MPYDRLPDSCIYEPNDKLWVWQVSTSSDEDEDGSNQEKMYFDNHEMVRVQVVGEEWHSEKMNGQIDISTDIDADSQSLDSRKASFKIIGSMQSEGLGVCLWWDQPDHESVALA